MPGFVGIAGEVGEFHLEACKRGAARMRHHPWYASQIFQEPHLILHQIREEGSPETALAAIPGDLSGETREKQAWVANEAHDIRVWADGDVYFDEHPDAGSARRELVRRLVRGLKENKLHEVLAEVDGEYVAVIRDVAQKKLHLITDRFGFAPIYYRRSAKQFFFASELKVFPDMDTGILTPDADAMKCFLEHGHLLWDETWFEEVKLLPPASHLTVAYNDGLEVSLETYWSWNQIPRLNLSFEEAVEMFADYWQRAVNSRLIAEPMSILLSGGLDSRLIAAAAPAERLAGGVTFGEQNCLDISLAAEVCRTKGVPHYVFELTPENAFCGRSDAVWRCDAMTSLADLHASQFLTGMREVAPASLNGFIGGAIAGGIYVRRADDRGQRPSRTLARRLFGKYEEKVPVDSSYFDAPHGDLLLLATRARRQTAVGTREGSLTVSQIKPFIAKEFVEFLYGLPDHYRYGKRLYKASCLRHYSEYFARIPYQLTGQPITTQTDGVAAWTMEFRRKLGRIPVKLGLRRDNTQFLNYATAMKASLEVQEWRKLLSPEQSLLKQVVFRRTSMRPPTNITGEKGTENQKAISISSDPTRGMERYLRAATLELWLRRVLR